MTARRFAGPSVGAAMVLILAACGTGADPQPAPSSAASTAPSLTPTPTPVPSPTETDPTEADPVETVIVDLTDLPTGELPKVDVVVGSTLFHDGTSTTLDVDSEPFPPILLGSLDGTPYVVVANQIYRVVGDGSLTAVGVPHDSYSYLPRMSAATGHVLFAVANRSVNYIKVAVVDARTGDVVARFRDSDERDALDPADRPTFYAMGLGRPRMG